MRKSKNSSNSKKNMTTPSKSDMPMLKQKSQKQISKIELHEAHSWGNSWQHSGQNEKSYSWKNSSLEKVSRLYMYSRNSYEMLRRNFFVLLHEPYHTIASKIRHYASRGVCVRVIHLNGWDDGDSRVYSSHSLTSQTLVKLGFFPLSQREYFDSSWYITLK